MKIKYDPRILKRIILVIDWLYNRSLKQSNPADYGFTAYTIGEQVFDTVRDQLVRVQSIGVDDYVHECREFRIRIIVKADDGRKKPYSITEYPKWFVNRLIKNGKAYTHKNGKPIKWENN